MAEDPFIIDFFRFNGKVILLAAIPHPTDMTDGLGGDFSFGTANFLHLRPTKFLESSQMIPIKFMTLRRNFTVLSVDKHTRRSGNHFFYLKFGSLHLIPIQLKYIIIFLFQYPKIGKT